jgi:hypothetical protein
VLRVAPTASVVAETTPKPISRVEFELPDNFQKAATTVVFNTEVLRAFDQATQLDVAASLASATAAAMDAEIVNLLVSGGTLSTSSEVGSLLAQLSNGSPRTPVLLGSWDALAPLAPDLRDLRDLGLQIIVMPGASGRLIALDASGVLFGDGGAEVTVARHASVAMTDDGSGSPTNNLWQLNQVGLRAERFFKLAFRGDAVVYCNL